jgi:hypothetical protein
MEALANIFIILMTISPYGMLFIKEGNFRVRLLLANMAALAIFSLMWIAVYLGWDSLTPVALTYSICMAAIVALNFSIILVSWVAAVLVRWT